MLYQRISVLFAHITHANIDVPRKIDNVLSFIFVTPNMHKIHHHFQLPLTDSNYGNIFSVWDRLFGTYSNVEDQKSIVYGIDTHMNKKASSSLKSLLMMPFNKLNKINNSKFSK